MFGILETIAVPQTGVYDSFEELEKELSARMNRDGYKVVKARSHRRPFTGPDGVATTALMRFDLVCDRGGQPYKSTAKKHKTHTKKTDCPWKAKAVRRKTIGGWVLSIICDQHNHEPSTPEPEELEAVEAAETDVEEDAEDDGPRPDPETAAALQVAGVSDSVLRLNGETFRMLKNDYRKMTQAGRLNALSQMQIRIAAIYAVQNEDTQREQRQKLQNQRHQAMEANRSRLAASKGRSRRQQTQSNQQSLNQVAASASTAQQVQNSSQASQPSPQDEQQQQQQQDEELHSQDGQQHQPTNNISFPQTTEAQQLMLQQQQFQAGDNQIQQTPVPVPNLAPRFQNYTPTTKRGR